MNFHRMNLQLALVSVDCNNFEISQIMTMLRHGYDHVVLIYM